VKGVVVIPKGKEQCRVVPPDKQRLKVSQVNSMVRPMR
jgi:hypothetical protein